jgi:hypothetical protein
MHSARGRLGRPCAAALFVALPLVAAYLIVAPPAADLAAATYRGDLFARVGFTTWDTGWYAAHGHWLPAYSLLSPALGALLGVRVVLALSAVAASVLFALTAERAFGTEAARVAAAWFALGFCVGLLSGRVPYDLGFALGLGAVLALMRGRLALALGLALLTSVASPVAGAFIALAGVAGGLEGVFRKKAIPTRARGASRKESTDTHLELRADPEHHSGGTALMLDRDAQRWLGLTVAAIAPILALSLAYPEGGYEPFAPSAFWPALAGVLLVALFLPRSPLGPRGRGVVRLGAALYALMLLGAYAIHTPMGGNAARLGPLLAAPLLAGVLWDRQRGTLLLLAPLLFYWQLATPIRDYSSIAGDPSVHASYYAPLRSELRRLTGGRPTIVEVPLTKAHWEASYLAGHDGISLARGWERQLDTRYAALFYRPRLSASEYRVWLRENRVEYVALPDAPLDRAGRLEAALIAARPGTRTRGGHVETVAGERGVPYLRELWRSAHWRLYRAMG